MGVCEFGDGKVLKMMPRSKQTLTAQLISGRRNTPHPRQTTFRLRFLSELHIAKHLQLWFHVFGCLLLCHWWESDEAPVYNVLWFLDTPGFNIPHIQWYLLYPMFNYGLTNYGGKLLFSMFLIHFGKILIIVQKATTTIGRIMINSVFVNSNEWIVE